MLWKITGEGAEPIVAKSMQFSGIGPLTIYQVGNDYFVEASDMTSMGLWRNKFLEQELPKIKKSLGMSDPMDKLKNIRVRITKEDESERERELVLAKIKKEQELLAKKKKEQELAKKKKLIDLPDKLKLK